MAIRDTVKRVSEYCYTVTVGGGELILKADHRIEVRDGFQKKLPRGHEEKPTRDITRVFHPVGGFEAVPFYIELESGKKFWIKLREGVR